MQQTFVCPSCQQPFVAQQVANYDVKTQCPTCRSVVLIPRSPTAADPGYPAPGLAFPSVISPTGTAYPSGFESSPLASRSAKRQEKARPLASVLGMLFVVGPIGATMVFGFHVLATYFGWRSELPWSVLQAIGATWGIAIIVSAVLAVFVFQNRFALRPRSYLTIAIVCGGVWLPLEYVWPRWIVEDNAAHYCDRDIGRLWPYERDGKVTRRASGAWKDGHFQFKGELLLNNKKRAEWSGSAKPGLSVFFVPLRGFGSKVDVKYFYD